MKISVATPSGKVFPFECKSTDIIEDLKQKASDEEGVSSQELMLIFLEKEMDETMTLDAAGVKEGSMLHLKVRVLGGAPGMYVIFLCLSSITNILAIRNDI